MKESLSTTEAIKKKYKGATIVFKVVLVIHILFWIFYLCFLSRLGYEFMETVHWFVGVFTILCMAVEKKIKPWEMKPGEACPEEYETYKGWRKAALGVFVITMLFFL